MADRQQQSTPVVNNSPHPFADEQFLAVAVSTKEYENSLALCPDVWDVGGVPRESFASPWAVHSPRIEELVTWQGRVTDEFVDTIVDEIETYLR